MKYILYFFCSILVVVGCNSEKKIKKSSKVFSALQATETNIDFNNKLQETETLNYFTYTSIYMGGGISIGDINNDGLLDLFFTGNQVENRLYLNKGDFKFEDITKKAKISGDNRWYTGTTMVDINGDGFLDIYCAVSGKEGEKKNQLFINNKDNTFTEKAEEYGIADEGNSVQATFFDYDNDGDLDMYLANYPIAHPSTSNMVYKNKMQNVKDLESDKLFKNEEGKFVDVSEQSGVKNYSFSLGITASDVNNDGWVDLYVSNDYSVPDFLYINNQDGTFKEVIKKATSQTAFYGMGIDIADINNDGFMDIFQADMDSDDNRRQKANMSSMNPRLFYETVLYGFHYQYMHNCLQLNSGYIENGIPKFSNISRLTGTSSTDWSWAPLFADFDNDGFKDLFITNGTRREVNNKDFFNSIGKTEYNELSLLEKTKRIPSEKIDNFMFKNLNGLEFSKVNKEWGISHEGFSNGVAYADLDNDGDLDLVVNNIDEPASVFKNNASETSNYLKVKCNAGKKNTNGLGTKIYVYSGQQKQVQELTLTRGFQSSVAPEVHFGLGNNTKIDSVKVVWNTKEIEVLKNLETNQTLTFEKKNAIQISTIEKNKEDKLFIENKGLAQQIKHVENQYDDFQTQVLLPHKMSTLGPAIAVKDVNNDGLQDFFLGGSCGKSAAIYLQKEEGFIKQDLNTFQKDNLSEDVGALFIDVDNDGDQDLYVVSGGYEVPENSDRLKDRLYSNDGKGNFTKESQFSELKISGSKAYQIDFNKDGKQDVLVLGRQLPGKYPMPVTSVLLENNSTTQSVKFIDKTAELAPVFQNLGMATSAVVTDFNKDGWEDLIIVGEWMGIKAFKNTKGKFEDVSGDMGLSDTNGWWWSIAQADFDNDGDTDYIVGNNGLNYKYKASENETFDIYVKDFDKNLKSDIVLSYYNKGKQYPVRGRQCSSEQIPGIKHKFKNYDQYSRATLIDVYGKKNLENSLHYQVKSFASVYLENDNGKFMIRKLPVETQLSSINQIITDDFDKDGNIDALIAGNLHNSEVETPRNDAGYGLFLKGNGKGDLKPIPVTQSGFYSAGDVKDLQQIKIGNTNYVLSAKNDDYLQFIKISNK
ncbi:VCBS repeat-containing protein [Tenacibaculum agarivorans]|uniref:VCBS repeat-containing protein n=1 Tax=Tenacibaculum agarivorans TaxID=1908389 RepID=UPI0009F9C6AC|nr:VCBS repeat-containing protein [Tenacibaculum agarivorans]